MTNSCDPRHTRRGLWAVAAAALAALVMTSVAGAHGYQAGPLKIGHPWARPALAGRAGGGYLTVTNTGRAADTLIAAASPVAARVTLHEMRMNGAVMSMRPVKALAIAPGATLTLAPGGYHLMLEGLKRELKVGERVPGTLTFQKAGTVNIEFAVQAAPPDHAHPM